MRHLTHSQYRQPWVKCLTLLVLLSVSSDLALHSAQAATVLEQKVTKKDGVYHVRVRSRIELPIEQTWALTDYQRLPLMRDTIKQAYILRPANQHIPATRVFVLSRICISFFCRDARYEQEFFIRKPGAILHGTIDPSVSDFKIGEMTWQLQAIAATSTAAEATELLFTADAKLGFWLPPLIGRMAVKSALRREAEASASGLERIAADRSAAGL